MKRTKEQTQTQGTQIPGNIAQIDALRGCRDFLANVLKRDGRDVIIEVFDTDIVRHFGAVCRALGENGTDNQLLVVHNLPTSDCGSTSPA